MTELKLDFNNVKYFGDIHKIIKKAFDFPDYYGENLSALWDCLNGDFCPLDAKIDIYGTECLNDKFDGYGEKIKKLFEELPNGYGNENIKIFIHS